MMSIRWIVPLLLTGTALRAQQPACNTCSVPSVTGSEKAVKPAAPAEELKQLDIDLDTAKLRGDKAAVAAALAEDMIVVDASGNVTPRERLLARLSPASPSSKMSIATVEAQVLLYGDTAVVTSKKTRKFEYRGHAESNDYRETNTYVHRDGRWLEIVSQRLDEPPPYSAKDVAFDILFDEQQALGDTKATVVIVEYSDYQCPFCRRFAAETFARVEKEYVRTGKALLTFRDNPMEHLHPLALGAATAAQCVASAGKFWQMNQRLLRDPVELTPEDLARDARELGIDSARFERCVQDPAVAQKIREAMNEADRIGARGTPMFLVGWRRPGEKTVHALRMIEGAYPYDVFRATLDGVLRARKS